MTFSKLASIFVTMLSLAVVANAQADQAEFGFACVSVDQNARVEVSFSAGSSEEGEPRALTMVFKDPTVSPRNQLIAKFSAVDGLLNNDGGRILAQVDLSHPDSSRRGERIGGTLLGYLSTIELNIAFRPGKPLKNGASFSGYVVYTKINGVELTQDFDCTFKADVSALAEDVSPNEASLL